MSLTCTLNTLKLKAVAVKPFVATVKFVAKAVNCHA